MTSLSLSGAVSGSCCDDVKVTGMLSPWAVPYSAVREHRPWTLTASGNHISPSGHAGVWVRQKKRKQKRGGNGRKRWTMRRMSSLLSASSTRGMTSYRLNTGLYEGGSQRIPARVTRFLRELHAYPGTAGSGESCRFLPGGRLYQPCNIRQAITGTRASQVPESRICAGNHRRDVDLIRADDQVFSLPPSHVCL